MPVCRGNCRPAHPPAPRSPEDSRRPGTRWPAAWRERTRGCAAFRKGAAGPLAFAHLAVQVSFEAKIGALSSRYWNGALRSRGRLSVSDSASLSRPGFHCCYRSHRGQRVGSRGATTFAARGSGGARRCVSPNGERTAPVRSCPRAPRFTGRHGTWCRAETLWDSPGCRGSAVATLAASLRSNAQFRELDPHWSRFRAIVALGWRRLG
jgi:hypothetical protein